MKIDGRIELAIGIGWIGFWLGVAVNSVNQVIEIPSPGEKYGWRILPSIFIVVIVPFIFGFLAGRKWSS